MGSNIFMQCQTSNILCEIIFIYDKICFNGYTYGATDGTTGGGRPTRRTRCKIATSKKSAYEEVRYVFYHTQFYIILNINQLKTIYRYINARARLSGARGLYSFIR